MSGPYGRTHDSVSISIYLGVAHTTQHSQRLIANATSNRKITDCPCFMLGDSPQWDSVETKQVKDYLQSTDVDFSSLSIDSLFYNI